MKKTNYERGGHFLDTISPKFYAPLINRTCKNYSVHFTYFWTQSGLQGLKLSCAFCDYLDNSSLDFNTFSNCCLEIVLGKNVKTGTV